MDSQKIQEALKSVKFPGFSRDIVSFGLIREVEINEGLVQIGVEITTGDSQIPEQIAADIKAVIGALNGVNEVKVRMEISTPQQPQPNPANDTSGAQSNHPAMQQVRYTIAVASGKGGEGVAQGGTDGLGGRGDGGGSG